MDHHFFMDIAKTVAKNSPMTFNMGAVLVDKKGRMVSTGFNSYRTHPHYGTKKTSYRHMHAEGNCIYNAVKKGLKVKGCKLYVYRRNWNLAKPCAHCQSLIEEAGIRVVYYTDKSYDGKPIIVAEKRFNVV